MYVTNAHPKIILIVLEPCLASQRWWREFCTKLLGLATNREKERETKKHPAKSVPQSFGLFCCINLCMGVTEVWTEREEKNICVCVGSWPRVHARIAKELGSKFHSHAKRLPGLISKCTICVNEVGRKIPRKLSISRRCTPRFYWLHPFVLWEKSKFSKFRFMPVCSYFIRET